MGFEPTPSSFSFPTTLIKLCVQLKIRHAPLFCFLIVCSPLSGKHMPLMHFDLLITVVTTLGLLK